MRNFLALGLLAVLSALCGCADMGYISGYSSGYYDPWYYHGRYDYDDIYVPVYPDNNPGNRPDRPDGRPLRPSHPIAMPDGPSVSPRPSIPTRARPMGSSFSGGMSRGLGMRGGGGRGR